MKTFAIRPKIYFEDGAMELLKDLEASCAFIVSDGVMEKLGYLQKAIDYLAESGIKATVFKEVKPDPDVKVIAAGIQKYQETKADAVIALGGGSVIDSAKGIIYSLWQFQKASGDEWKKPLFIAIPSTSGTGSEVTDFSVITAEGEKLCLVDGLMAPDIAILDSACLQHVPQQVVADTGIDALAHAIEAYVSNEATDCTDALAEKAAELIFAHLKDMYKDAAQPYPRARIQNASCLAGMAFTNSGLGINHSLAHALGARFHISHGRANALLLCAVIEYNADLGGKSKSCAAQKYAGLAARLQLPARTCREGVMNLLQAVRDLKGALKLPESIGAAGIDRQEFEAALSDMAEAALADRCTPTNPRQPGKEELIAIYKKAF